MYEEKLKREGLASDLSEKDLFLRVYFRGLDERQEIQRQLTMSVDRKLPWTFREGASLDRVAAQVKRHGVLSKREDPYSSAFKAGLPMQMNQLRNARKEVHRKASAMKKSLGRPLTRTEKSSIVDEQYTLLKKQGVVDALRIKQGNRAPVRRFAGNFVYKQVDAGQSTRKLPHVIKLLEQGSVGAGLASYPWSKGTGGRTSGHAVVLRDYDPGTGEFVVTNPWWLGSFGFKRHDRINAQEFMRNLEVYGWLQDTRPVAMRKTGPTEVAMARISKGTKSQPGRTGAASAKTASGGGLLAKLFGKRSPAKPAKPDAKVAKTKKSTAVAKVDKTVAKTGKAKPKGLLWKLFNKKKATSAADEKPVSKLKDAKVAKKTNKIKKAAPTATQPRKKKGLLYKLFRKKAAKPAKPARTHQAAAPSRAKKKAAPSKKKAAPAKPGATEKPKGLLYKWFKKKS